MVDGDEWYMTAGRLTVNRACTQISQERRGISYGVHQIEEEQDISSHTYPETLSKTFNGPKLTYYTV